MTKVPSNFGTEFRQEFDAAFDKERAGQAYGEVGRVVKAARLRYLKKLFTKYRRGDIIARALSGFTDIALVGIAYEAIPKHLSEQIAILAVGGYGRELLAPFSDVDLLILHNDLNQDVLKPVVEKLLYPFWDAGVAIGQSVHTPKSAVVFASEDLHSQTSFIDARYLFGASNLSNEFQVRYEKLRSRSKKKFTAEKLDEQETRHELSAQSRFLIEPDLKEGKGALRDIHSIEWIHKAILGEGLGKEDSELLDADDVVTLRKAERFLWTLRVFLHDLRGRADERLSFDLQPALAERLNYADRPYITATERMMKHYFLTVSDIGRVTRLFVARLEERNAKLSQRTPRLLPKALSTDEMGGNINLKLMTGRLDFKNQERARKTPSDLFRIFRAFAKKPTYDFHPNALSLVAECTPLITKKVRRDPDISNLFIASLTQAKEPVKLLRVMSETGLLGKFLPTIGKIKGRIEYGLYRRFTIDEHIFQSIGILAELKSGALKNTHPIASAIVSKAKNPSLFYLAVLLHEARWATRDKNVDASTRLVERIAKRLGLSDEDATLISWCAARRHYMVEIAERRNMGAPQVILNFAEASQSRERLELMLVLSVCHIRAISEQAWDDWTRRQMTSLYEGALACLENGEVGLSDWFEKRRIEVDAKISPLIADWPAAERVSFMSTISSEMVSTLTADTIARIGLLSQNIDVSNERAGISASIIDGSIEAIVIAPDRRGLLADMAGAIASSGASVRAVHAIEFSDGRIVDIFSIRAIDVDVDAELVRRLHRALLTAAKSTDSTSPTLSKRIGDRRHIFNVAAKINVDSQVSADCLVVEAEGRDRPGLLHMLASELAEIGVIIRSAHVATYGARAVDTFYLQDAPAYKIVDERRIQSIRQRLLSVLLEG